jgi:hypothetical protein
VKIKKEASGERVCSVGDPEMRHGRKSASKRFDGHMLSIGTEVESQLITAVEVTAASAPDDKDALEMTRESGRALEAEVREVLTDCAYGDGENRERFREAGIELRAKVPAQGGGEYFKKTDFVIDLGEMTCTCSAGQTTDVLRGMGQGSGQPRQSFVFAGGVCASCPLRERSFKASPQPRGRRVTLHPQEALLQEAREWQRSPDFDRLRKQRQVVEHRIARMMQLGMRQARYRGRHKTLFQALMTAAVANLTLIAGKVGLRPATETSATGLRAALAATGTPQAASRTVRAWLRRALDRLNQFRTASDRSLTPRTLAFATPGFRPRF